MSMIFLCYLNLLDPEIEKKAEIKGYLINSDLGKSTILRHDFLDSHLL